MQVIVLPNRRHSTPQLRVLGQLTAMAHVHLVQVQYDLPDPLQCGPALFVEYTGLGHGQVVLVIGHHVVTVQVVDDGRGYQVLDVLHVSHDE